MTEGIASKKCPRKERGVDIDRSQQVSASKRSRVLYTIHQTCVSSSVHVISFVTLSVPNALHHPHLLLTLLIKSSCLFLPPASLIILTVI